MKRLVRNLLACLSLAFVAAPGRVPGQSETPENPPVPCDHCACYDWAAAKLSITGNQNARKQAHPGDGDDLKVVPDAEGRIKLTLDVTLIGSGECCTDIGIVARVTDQAGRIQDFSGQSIELSEREWAFPLDIRYYAKKNSVSTVPADAIPCAKYRVTKGDCESGCHEVCQVTADPSGSVSSVKFTVPVGVSDFGDQEAFIEAHFDTLPNPGRAALKLVAAPEITATVDGTGMTSVATDSMKAIITDAGTGTDPNRYIITVSHDPANPGTSQFRTITVESPTPTSLRVSTTFAGSTRVMEWTRTIPVAGTEVWTFTDGDGLRKVENTKTMVNSVIREERVKTWERDPANSANYLLISDRKLTYEKLFHRWELRQVAVDPGGSNLISSWTYHLTGEGAGLPATFNRYDGYYENHYHLYNSVHGVHWRWTDSPFKDGVNNVFRESSEWNPASSTLFSLTRVNLVQISQTLTSYTPLSKTVKAYSSGTQSTTTVTTYKDPAASLGLGGKPERVTHPDGTITTYDYGTNGLGERTVTVSTGAPSGAVVGEGTATTTTVSKKGRVIASRTDAVGTGAPSILDHWVAATFDVSLQVTDDLGRIRKIEYFPLNAGGAAWTTSMTFNCCGVATETDRQGVTTSYTYDDLKRRVTSTRSGVVSHTVYAGLATDSHRYGIGGSPATSNRIARQARNLAGTITTSSSPDASSLIAGALVDTTTATTYQPMVGLSSRTVTTVPGGFTQTTDAYRDGRTASTSGTLQPEMNYNYSVDATGLVTTSSYPGNLEVTVSTTDWAGRTAKVTRGGATTNYFYKSNGQLERVTDPDNVSTLFAYNARGERTITALDVDGDNTIDYDGSNGLDQVTFTESNPGTHAGHDVMTTTTKVYAGDNNATATTVSTSHQTHDGLRSWTITPGVANPATHVIDKTTWSQTSTSPDGTYSLSTINADGLTDAVEHYSAGSPGTLISSVDYTYDTLKRTQTTVDSRTGTTTTTYVSTTCDGVQSVTDPGGRVTGFTYDSRGRRITTTLPDTTVAHTSYYPHNQVKATWGTQSDPTFLTYDYAHRRKELHTWRENPGLNQSMNTPPTSPASSVTTWNYSTTTGFLTSKRDAANKGVDYEYTTAGRLWKRTWARGGTTIYTYTAGRLTNTDYPTGTPDVTTQYNRLGQPRFVTQTLQSEIEYTYDANFFLDTEIVRYDINQDGDYADAVDQVRTLDRSVDSSGRPNGWQLVNSGNPNPIENRADYTFDSAGRLGTVADGTNTFTYGYQYNQTTAADPRVGSTTGTKQDFIPYTLTKAGSAVPPVLPALQTVRTYEARRDALATIENKAGTTTRSSYTYTVNGIGQRTGLTTTFTLGGGLAGNHGSTAWTYDHLGQLKTANAPETIGSADADRYFEYDEIGNRKFFRANTSTNSGGTLTEYFGALAPNNTNGANALNQYARIKRGLTTRIPVYDFDGNATSYPLPAHNSLSTLAWDAENRLTSVTVNGVTTTYRYDALSRRIARINGGVTTLYRYDGWNCIAEYTGSTTLSEIRTWGLDLSGSGQGAGGVGGLLAEKTGGTYYFPTFDGNGNVSEYLNANGDTIAHFEYDPFGNTVVNAGSVSLFNYRFSTKPLDSETGLFYYGYRFYDPVTGRWPSRDPIGERGGVNLYVMVKNRVIGSWDYLGLDAQWHHRFSQEFEKFFLKIELDLHCAENGHFLNTKDHTMLHNHIKLGPEGKKYNDYIGDVIADLENKLENKIITKGEAVNSIRSVVESVEKLPKIKILFENGAPIPKGYNYSEYNEKWNSTQRSELIRRAFSVKSSKSVFLEKGGKIGGKLLFALTIVTAPSSFAEGQDFAESVYGASEPVQHVSGALQVVLPMGPAGATATFDMTQDEVAAGNDGFGAMVETMLNPTSRRWLPYQILLGTYEALR